MITTVLSTLSTFALCMNVLAATHNVRQQLRLSWQGRAIDTFNQCSSTFDDFARERAAVETSADDQAMSRLRPRVRLIADRFETLVERTIGEPDHAAALARLRSILAGAKGGGVFRAFA